MCVYVCVCVFGVSPEGSIITLVLDVAFLGLVLGLLLLLGQLEVGEEVFGRAETRRLHQLKLTTPLRLGRAEKRG